eukprot:7657277-Prorocentrum_lima.AAC.1
MEGFDPHTWKFYSSPLTGAAGGVAILAKRTWLRQFEAAFYGIIPGRVAALVVRTEHIKLVIFTLHLEPVEEGLAYLE